MNNQIKQLKTSNQKSKTENKTFAKRVYRPTVDKINSAVVDAFIERTNITKKLKNFISRTKKFDWKFYIASEWVKDLLWNIYGKIRYTRIKRFFFRLRHGMTFIDFAEYGNLGVYKRLKKDLIIYKKLASKIIIVEDDSFRIVDELLALIDDVLLETYNEEKWRKKHNVSNESESDIEYHLYIDWYNEKYNAFSKKEMKILRKYITCGYYRNADDSNERKYTDFDEIDRIHEKRNEQFKELMGNLNELWF